MSSGDFDSQTPQPDDEAAVRALYKQLMDAWNKGSGEAELSCGYFRTGYGR